MLNEIKKFIIDACDKIKTSTEIAWYKMVSLYAGHEFLFNVITIALVIFLLIMVYTR